MYILIPSTCGVLSGATGKSAKADLELLKQELGADYDYEHYSHDNDLDSKYDSTAFTNPLDDDNVSPSLLFSDPVDMECDLEFEEIPYFPDLPEQLLLTGGQVYIYIYILYTYIYTHAY